MISLKSKKATQQRGMSLIEVLVATALISIISAGVATLITNMSRQQKGVQAKDQQRDFTTSVRDILSDQTACRNTFNGVNPTTNTTNALNATSAMRTEIRDSLNNVRYTTGGPAGQAGAMLTITNMGLAEWQPDPLSIAGTNEFGTATFIINLEKTDGENTGVRNIAPDRVTIRFWLDEASTTVNDCVTLSGSSDTLWQISTASPNDIFRQSRVGVGPGFVGGTGFNADFHVRGTSLIRDGLNIGSEVAPTATLSVVGTGTGLIGQRLTVGTAALDNANTLSVTGNGFFSTSLNTGTTATIGTFLTVTQSATIGTEMRVTANATVGNNARIGNNLIIGNNLTVLNQASAETYVVTSDARLKENLSVVDGLDIIKVINGYKFNWKKNNKKDIGVIAQEIEKVLPELVYSDADGIKRVNYQGLIPVLIESIHQLEKKNQDLEARLQALESKENSSKK